MALGKLPVPGRPAGLDTRRARAYCACNRCGWGVVWPFHCLSFVSLPLGDGPTYTEILSQSAIKSKTTNQPLVFNFLYLFQFFNNNAMY